MKPIKTFVIRTVLCLFAAWQPALNLAQATSSTVKASQPLLLRLELGYNRLALGEVKTLYDAIAQFYRGANISFPTQRKFPGNALIGFEAMHSFRPGVSAGVGVLYTRTRAFSLYGDYAGELDVNAKVKLLAITGIIEKDFSTNKLWRPYCGFRGSLLLGWSEFVERLSIDDEFGGFKETAILSAHGIGYGAELSVGAKYFLKGIVFSASAGYRYAMIPNMEGELRFNGVSQGSDKVYDSSGGTLEFDCSGIVLAVGVGVAIVR